MRQDSTFIWYVPFFQTISCFNDFYASLSNKWKVGKIKLFVYLFFECHPQDSTSTFFSTPPLTRQRNTLIDAYYLWISHRESSLPRVVCPTLPKLANFPPPPPLWYRPLRMQRGRCNNFIAFVTFILTHGEVAALRGLRKSASLVCKFLPPYLWHYYVKVYLPRREGGVV